MIVVVGAGVAGLTAVNRLVTAGADVTLVTTGRLAVMLSQRETLPWVCGCCSSECR